MAEVSADNISVEYSDSDPFVQFFDNNVIDKSGNNNGSFDPGETVDFVVTLLNYGEPATGVSAQLTSSDPHVTIQQDSSEFADLGTGELATNAAIPYVVEADAHIVDGYLADFTLTVSHSGGTNVSQFKVCIGRFQYAVWDPSPDRSSGPVIASTLAELGFSGNYSEELHPNLIERYQTLWISCGIYSSNYIIGAGSVEAATVVDFLNAGGCVYLEGGDVWYYDPGVGGYNFNALFGILAVADGTGDAGTIAGIPGTFAAGMTFSYTGENDWIDHINPSGSASLLLQNRTPAYGCGVMYDAGTYRTVGASFELAGLVDGAEPSSKAMLALNIMSFFLPSTTAVDESVPAYEARGLQAYPNPFNPNTLVSFSLPKAQMVELAVYDLSGRRLRTLVKDVLAAGPWEFVWDGRDRSGHSLASGVYIARMQSRAITDSHKLMLLK